MDDDQELETQVTNATNSDTSDDADQSTDLQDTGNREEQGQNNDADEEQNQDDDKGDNTGDDADLEDEDESEDYLPPFDLSPTATGAQQNNQASNAQPFDIKTLRDESGTIDPAKANEAIEKYAQEKAEKMLNQFTSGSQQETQARNQLSAQWTKSATKYPAVTKSKDLVKIASDLHLNSITAAREGRGRYVSPMAAMKRVDAMQRRIAKNSYNSAKSRKSVVKTGGAERPGGKGNAKAPASDYQTARTQAQSDDPKIAKQGRMEVLRLRRENRESS